MRAVDVTKYLVFGILLGTGSEELHAAPPSPLWTEKSQVRPLDPNAPVSMRAFAELARELSSAIVNIGVKRRMEGVLPFQPLEGQGLGSGFIIRRDGLVLTNAHVIENAEEISVKLDNEQEYAAKVVGVFKPLDIALLSFEPEPSANLVVAPLGNSEQVEIGEWVIAIGNPFGLNHTVTAGIVSAKGRRDVTPGNEMNLARFIQTDASINPGNSGGPLINIRGEVIGINTAINAAGQGIGFAVPIDMVKTVLPQLATGRVSRSYLGVVVGPVSRELQRALGMSRRVGALVTRVAPGSPASLGGLRPDDIIVSFDGVEIGHWEDLPWFASIAGVGKKARLEIQRGARRLPVEVALGPHPDTVADATEKEKSHPALPRLGVKVSPLPSDKAEAMKLAPDAGVLVLAVEEDSLGRSLGLRKGDVILAVNGVPMKDVGTFERTLAAVTRGSTLTLSMRRGPLHLVKRVAV